MLNVQGARCALILAVPVLALAACTRDPASVASGETTAAAATAREPGVDWARDALARNPAIELLAVDPKGIFTVRLRQSGQLRTISMDELIAAPAGGEVASADASAVAVPAPTSADAETAAPAAPAAPAADVTVTRDAGRISITGPGVSIASAAAVAADTAAPAMASTQTGSAERRDGQPIVCQGGRLMHIDNRVIEFDGDGLIVQDGCDLYLTNSRITAAGTAITVMRGKIHIVNSTVKGGRSSIDASQGAQVFMSSASIDGLQRRSDTAQITDLGGNRYR